MKYNFKKMVPEAKLPTRHTHNSAGVDFYAAHKAVISAGGSFIISTGISWNPIMINWSKDEDGLDIIKNPFPNCRLTLIIQSRSGYAFKHEIEASNAGVIDQDYTPHGDEEAIIKVKLYNHGKEDFFIFIGDKICQGVPQLVPYFDDVETLDNTRNGKGFGSSDEKEKY